MYLILQNEKIGLCPKKLTVNTDTREATDKGRKEMETDETDPMIQLPLFNQYELELQKDIVKWQKGDLPFTHSAGPSHMLMCTELY